MLTNFLNVEQLTAMAEEQVTATAEEQLTAIHGLVKLVCDRHQYDSMCPASVWQLPSHPNSLHST